MSKNNFFILLAKFFLLSNCPPIGGQAVIEGVMMRNGDMYGLAVRQASGEICAQRLPWYVLTRNKWLLLPFVRGFPYLLETLINGIHALNRSVELSDPESSGQSDTDGKAGIFLSLVLALLVALLLFVIAPHLLSVFMLMLGTGGDVDGLTFHLWDGLYKCAIFMAYIWLISLVPDIHRVYQYHGAEHKTIHAWEQELEVNWARAHVMSRLHPRCGTTFLLFVICISIILQAFCVPILLKIWHPEGLIAKHAYTLFFKLLLVIPISAIAYELIRYAARLPEGCLATLLQSPGLALQRMTTREPTREQLEVAVVALAEAVGHDSETTIQTAGFTHLPFSPGHL